MRRLSLALVLVLITSTLAAEGWDTIYKARLDASAAYLEAKLALKSAEVAYNHYIEPYLPTLSLATTTGSALSLGNDGFTAGVLTPSLTWRTCSGPTSPSRRAQGYFVGRNRLLKFQPEPDPHLFTETGADRLDAEAPSSPRRRRQKS